jgi:hypothetical protein
VSLLGLVCGVLFGDVQLLVLLLGLFPFAVVSLAEGCGVA